MPTENSDLDFLKILNYIGGALIFFGIAFFISINWFSLSSFTKIFSTLGSAIAAYAVGVLLYLNRKYDAASSAFFMISALIFPVGLYVTFYLLHWSAENFIFVNLVVTTLCFAIFLFGQLLLERTVLVLFSIIFGTGFFIAVSDFMLYHLGDYIKDFDLYRIMIIGLSFMLLGRYLDYDKRYPLTGLLYFFGGLNILASSYCLGGFFFYNHEITTWKILTAILIMLSFYYSIILKSKSLLYLAAIFLVIYIVDMSSRFVNLLGDFVWPLVLIGIGFLLILVTYLVFTLQKRMKKR